MTSRGNRLPAEHAQCLDRRPSTTAPTSEKCCGCSETALPRATPSRRFRAGHAAYLPSIAASKCAASTGFVSTAIPAGLAAHDRSASRVESGVRWR